MEEEEDKVTAELNNTDDEILSLDLRSVLTKDELTQKLFKSDKFTRWQSGSHRLHIFLDSFDECLLEINKLAVILVDAIKNYKEHVKLKRLTLRIACRTAVLPSVLEPGLKKLFGEDSLKIYQLVPLRRQDVVKAAEANGIDPDAFLEEVSRKNLVPLAIKPITLNFILNNWHRYQSLENNSIYELYRYGCRCLCEENNPSRRDSGAIGDLDLDQRLIIAARIAAVTIFANRFGVWTGTDADYPRSKDQLILIDDDLCMREEVAKSNNFDITKPAIKEVLDTGLFSSGGEKRIGWSHQTYAEFLAAWYLKEHNVSVSFFQRRFYLSEDEHPEQLSKNPEQLSKDPEQLSKDPEQLSKDPEDKLIPQLHETAAWLATMIPDIREVILSSDPDVLVHSDIPPDPTLQEAVVSNLLMEYEQGKINQKLINYHLYEYEKLKHPKLAEQLRPYIVDATKPIEARYTAITMAHFCQLKELQNELVTLATDSAETIELRISAVQAIGEIGDETSILKLKPLALNPFLEDEQDMLKGYCLQALCNKRIYLTDDELFDFLAIPISNCYRVFISYTLVPMLKEKWLRQPRLKADFIKKYSNSDKFLNVLINLGKFDSDFGLDIIGDIYLKPRLADHDQDWMQDEVLRSRWEKLHKHFAQRIYDKLQQNNTASIDRTIEWYYKFANPKWLSEQFPSYFNFSEQGQLASEKAANQRPQQKLLEPSPRERVIFCLNQLEDGNLSAWWQLNREMTLEPYSRHYSNEFEPDLTKLPGWKEADEPTRTRIIEGAENYIINQKDINTDWIGKKSLCLDLYIPELAGYKAFLLLLNKAPQILETIPSETWRIWAPVIIAFPRGSEHYNSCLELVKRVYSNAPDQVIETLNILIDKENEQSDYIFVIRLVEKCWDKHLSDFILEKAKKPSIKPKCMGHLLEYILKHGSDEAKDEVIEYLQTLSKFSSLPPLKKDEREKVIIALTFLFYYQTADSWSSIWLILEQEPNLGRELIELVANPNKSFLGHLELKLNLNEKQLADLYIWLVRKYPYDEDPAHSNYFLGPREMVARLRDDILRQLKNIGTPDACEEVEGIIRECPQLPWLKKTLISAKDSMRRKTWEALEPKKVINKILAHDPRVNQTVPGNQGTSNNIVNLDNKGGIFIIGEKNTNNMAKNSKINTDGGDFINNSYNKNKGSVNNSKTLNTNKIGKGKRNTIKVTDPKTNPNRISILAIVTLVLTGLGLIGNGIFNEQIKRFLRIDQQPSLSPTPTVPSPSSTPDSE
ncbi:NACHT domain-containing protein [Moorena producens]|uniref:NACHT domain-containing protein n=1 Tax=Moorena producens TaxID=1155739 RepID=UPI003C771E87